MHKIEEIYELYKAHPLICTDTRSIETGSLFFALKGENFDANTFALEALNMGAVFSIVDDEKLPENNQLIKVDDVLSTMQALARHHRSHLKIPFIGLTGSNGKTTTKELLHAILSEKYNVLSTNGNFNNHIGVPLTILRINQEHELAIIEMGANHVGEIEFLSEIVQPNFGIITNIGKAHLKGFGSYEGVIQAKTELYNQIKMTEAVLFVSAEDNLLMAESKGIQRVLYGQGSDCMAEHTIDDSGRVKIFLGNLGLEIQTNLFGEYNFQNLLCSICVGRYFKLSDESIKKALSSYVPRNNRSQIVRTKENTIIMDAYNANPSSMKLALHSFNKLNALKKVVILGDMLELGDEEYTEHLKVIDQLKSMNLDRVFLVGDIFKSIKTDGSFDVFEKVEDLKEQFNSIKFTNCHFLIKGSRGIQLEKVLDVIN